MNDPISARDLIDSAAEFLLASDRGPAFRRFREAIIAADPDFIARGLEEQALRTPFDWPILDQLNRRLQSILNDSWLFPFGQRKFLDQLSFLESAFHQMKIDGASILEFGAGDYAPQLLSAYFYLNGARSCRSLEPLPVKDVSVACRALSEMITWMLMRPDLWRRTEITMKDYITRATNFDLAALANSDMDAALREVPVKHHVGLLEESGLKGFDFAYSIAVLEHVEDLRAVFSGLYRVVYPGGITCHVVDFTDHAFHAGLCSHRWGYLAEGGGDGFGVNRVRLSAMVAALEAEGFDTLEVKRVKGEVPAEVLCNILPEYKFLSRDDIETYQATIISRRRP